MSPELRTRIEAVCAIAPRTGVCYHGVLMPDGSFLQTGHTGCHAGVAYPVTYQYGKQRVSVTDTEYVLSVTQSRLRNPDREAAVAYLEWLCGPTSPHRIIAKEFNPDPEFAFDNGVILGDLSTAPKNLLQHFFVATRLATELAGAPERWKALVDAGVHPALAFIGVYEQASGGFTNSHSAMPVIFTEEWVKNWANGTPVNLDPAVWTDPGGPTLSTDAAFGNLPRPLTLSYPYKYDAPSYWETIAPLYPDRAAAKKVSNPWGRDMELPARPKSFDDLVYILKAEQERLEI